MHRISFIAALTAFCLAAIIFAGAVWATLAPLDFDRRIEWVQLKIEGLLPQAPHPEFVPTPLAQVEWTPELTATPVSTLVAAPTAVAPATRPAPTRTRAPTQASQPVVNTVPPRVALADFRHDYQRFNNCGPATLAILLSHFGRSETQYDLAPLLKGNKDDRNVSPDEIVALVHSMGLHALTRVNGDETEIKRFLAQGIPVMTEGWFVPHLENASGHYRLLSGYDDAATASTRGVGLTVQYVDAYPSSETGFFIAQDSYIGPNTKLPYVAFDLDWRVFNRTYIVVYSDAQESAVKAIVGDNMDDATMYARAREVAQREMALNANDPYAWFNLGSSLVGLGKYDEAANAFDKARVLKLPWRMMWYQFGPYEAYYHAARYREVIALADATLASSAGLEESLYYRGLAQLALGQKDAARASFQSALQSNPHFAPAKQALTGIGG
jgi:hypothetical protein